jgi:hypothetical protein
MAYDPHHHIGPKKNTSCLQCNMQRTLKWGRELKDL